MRRILLAIPLLAVCGLLNAQNVPSKPISGEEVAKNVEKVMKEINWSKDLDKLQEQAKKENKLVLWIQIVGDLDGGL